jgi:glycogen debranching enzyme
MQTETLEGVAQAPHETIETVEGAPFYIPALGPSARPRQVLKHGDAFAVFDSHGDMGASAGGPDGLFDHDTRFLSRLEFLINGMQPLLLGSRVRDDNLTLSVDLTNPDIYYDGHITLPRDTIHVVRTTYLWNGAAHQRFSIVNHGESEVSLTLSLAFGNDFADLFEVRGQRRSKRGKLEEHVRDTDHVTFAYTGLDNVQRLSDLYLQPAPSQLLTSAAVFRLNLKPRTPETLFLSVYCNGQRPPRRITFLRGLTSANRERRMGGRQLGSVETTNDVLNEALRRASADLGMLTTRTTEGPYPYAGIPWYSTTFGRDGLITAIQMLWLDPSLALGVLRRLAALQATTFDAKSESEPGKILHEMRGGEMSALKEVPFGRYFGSVDSTPLFLILLGLYVERTGDVATLRDLWPAAQKALNWMDQSGDVDHDGFLEYGSTSADGLQHGLRNQGWKDSFDAIYHADGPLAVGPVALCEVQGYAYAAKIHAARCARRLGDPDHAQRLDDAAADLARRFEEAFWCEDIGFYAIALDGAKKPCRVRSSNAGQLLWTGIIRPDRAKQIADALVSPAFFSGWGIRTIAQGETRYNPMSYHNGSIWPHDNSLIASGLSRYGFHDHVGKVFEAAVAAASYMELRRLPELYCGFRRRAGAGATLYPVACAPQAWASGALFLMIHSLLGIEFEPTTREIRFRNPRLPASFDQIELRMLSMNKATVDIELKRSGSGLSMRVLRNGGEVHVSMIVS